KPAVAASFTDLEDIPAANNDFIPENALNIRPKDVVPESQANGDFAHKDADDIDSAEKVVDSNATAGHEPVKEEMHSADVDPNFAVTQAAEIEQATSENSSYEVQGEYDPKADLSRFRMPPVTLLKDRQKSDNNVDLEEQEANKARITKVLSDYGIEITKIEAIVGPTVTLYKIVPAEGVRIAKIKRLEDDIAMSLAALGIRIIAPIPGESNIGIEVPNKEPQTVSIRSILGSKAYQDSKCQLPMALGATINNEVFITDLAKMPHLLVAGATGQGKSVGLNTIIASLIYKRHPSELKFVLVDPKMVEFSLYSCLEKHYLAKIPDAEEAIITDWTKVVDTLNSLCVEMDNRYQLLKNAQCRSITEYNEKFVHRRLNPEKGHRYLPYIVMIVDEFADLIMMAGKSVEAPIARIAQKARAVGMHLIIATQRPSTNVITGMIKANFPGRIAFAVRQRVDSQTILDCPGANQLIGKGDMLISTGGPLQRVQCAFISTEEVESICHYIDDQIGFPTAYILPDPPTEAAEGGGSGAVSLADRDPYFEEIARMVVQSNTASTSNIQRKYSIGYNRAGKIMDQLEMAGVVGPASGGKPRQVLMSPEDVEMLLSTL
ncbi:MAG: DNA translocase FtsK, partial [Muribaculaceae bacterium]|nr:DNA translocase FtsK [Muribaculaceae bacterium]